MITTKISGHMDGTLKPGVRILVEGEDQKLNVVLDVESARGLAISLLRVTEQISDDSCWLKIFRDRYPTDYADYENVQAFLTEITRLRASNVKHLAKTDN